MLQLAVPPRRLSSIVPERRNEPQNEGVAKGRLSGVRSHLAQVRPFFWAVLFFTHSVHSLLHCSTGASVGIIWRRCLGTVSEELPIRPEIGQVGIELVV